MIERVEAAIAKHIHETNEKPKRIVMTAMQYLELDKDLKLRDKIPDWQVRHLQYRGIPIWIEENPEEVAIDLEQIKAPTGNLFAVRRA